MAVPESSSTVSSFITSATTFPRTNNKSGPRNATRLAGISASIVVAHKRASSASNACTAPLDCTTDNSIFSVAESFPTTGRNEQSSESVQSRWPLSCASTAPVASNRLALELPFSVCSMDRSIVLADKLEPSGRRIAMAPPSAKMRSTADPLPVLKQFTNSLWATMRTSSASAFTSPLKSALYSLLEFSPGSNSKSTDLVH